MSQPTSHPNHGDQSGDQQSGDQQSGDQQSGAQEPGEHFDFGDRLVLRGESGYETARVDPIFNARKPNRFPAAILLAESDADVVAGVQLATARGWKVSVRAGGHSWAAWSVRDEALLIDLQAMRDMDVVCEVDDPQDPYTLVAVRPALRGGQDLTPFLDERNLQFTGGHCTTVGIGGFTLQGGQGWNSRTWGWACSNLMAIDVVTADGNLVHASETEHAELLWAARGSGPGFFGVVTKMYLRCRPKPAAMFHTTYVFPAEVFDELIEWAHAVLPTLDSRVEPVIAGSSAPMPDGSAAAGPYLVVHTTVMASSRDECATLLAPIHACPLKQRAWVCDEVVETSLREEGPFMDAQNPKFHRYHTDCLWTDASAAELIPRARRLFTDQPTKESFCIWYGWAPHKPLPDMAFSMEGNVYIAVYAINADEADDARVQEWVSSCMAELAPIAKGLYLGDSDFTRRGAKFMSEENYARVESLRDVWDPARRFVGYLHAASVKLNEN